MDAAAYEAVEARMRAGETVILDGGTGTELEKRGVPMNEQAWCATATDSADVLREVHADYIRAGAEIVIANTYPANRLGLAPAGAGDRVVELNTLAVQTALEARDATPSAYTVAVAGSMSHFLPMKPGTEAYPDLPTRAEMSAAAREQAGALASAGAEFIVCEMMSAPDLANPVIEAALETGLPVWTAFSCIRDDEGVLRSRRSRELDVGEMYDAMTLEGVRAAGVIHSPANITGEALEVLARHFEGPRFAYPDSGEFRMPHWQFVDIIEPAELVDYARTWRTNGVSAIGGCCGLSVEHIEALASGLR